MTQESSGFYTLPQVADGLGLSLYSVRRAVDTGQLDAREHASKYDCDPADPCHLEPGTQGHHFAIRRSDAEAWKAGRSIALQDRVKNGQHSRAWLAGYNAAKDEIESLEQAWHGDVYDFQNAVLEWLREGR